MNAEGYELCPTYPKYLYVPASASREVIEGSARFRSRGRLPVLTYLHKASGAALVRCAQPLVGVSNVRSEADEAYVDCLRRTNRYPSSKGGLLGELPLTFDIPFEKSK